MPATAMVIAPSSVTLPKSYTPGDHEREVLARWDASGVSAASVRPDDDRPPFAILIPPPNVTAALHLGHALNNTLQDVLVRVHRMRGYNVLWMPGTDHAGIATQSVVERRLLTEGRRRTDFSREDFVARVQAWKDEYEATITGQLRDLGASCDWTRRRFTMDPVCTRAVREAFFRLFRAGLVYRGKRLVNWDPVTCTALADDEVVMQEVDGTFYYLRYPIVDAHGTDTGEHVVVATTRPETMLGDTAVAVNPADPVRARFVGCRVRLPIVDRVIPVIADEYVVMPDPGSEEPKARFASGFLKVTPAHDPNDWEIGRRHLLPVINVMAPDASISDRHGWDDVSDAARPLLGLTREAARDAIVSWFRDRGLLEGTRPWRHSVGHSYRSHARIEPWLSDQWYVRVTDDRLVGEAQRALAPDQFDGTAPARRALSADEDGDPRHGDDDRLRAVHDGALRFYPPRYARTYQAWHDGLRDWCISRQLWWGHRIPVWTSPVLAAPDAERTAAAWRARPESTAGDLAVQVEERPGGAQVHLCLRRDPVAGTPLIGEIEAAGFRQDEDVLDTWFSSALWPLSTLGWPEPDAHAETRGLLDRFNPTSVLCTGRDIITLWVSRMVMFNRLLHGHRVPFRHVYIHPLIQDGHGQRMSKSLGNGVDPRDIIESHGADALRFVLTQMASTTQDVRLPVDMVSPHSGASFTPVEIVSPQGYRVAAPEQICPTTGRPMVSSYGVAAGLVQPDGHRPLARNTSTRFDTGRNFCNKLWNATRFALSVMQAAPPAGPGAPSNGAESPADAWIVARLRHAIRTIDQALGEYQFHLYAETIYDFVWGDLCDWYLEAIKPTARDNANQRQVLLTVLDATLRLLHPICPFITESLYPAVRAIGPAGLAGFPLPSADLLAVAAWPSPATDADTDAADAQAITRFDRVRTLVNALRAARAAHQVPPRRPITLHAGPAVRALIAEADGIVEALAGLGEVRTFPDQRPGGAVVVTFEGEEVLASGLTESVDPASERARLANLIAERERALKGFHAKLTNEGYVRNAPPAVVDETRRRALEAEADLEAARSALRSLG